MDNKSLYILAGYDDLTEEKLSAIQNKLYEAGFEGFQTKNIPMHFTLGSYDCNREEDLINRLKSIGDTIETFEVSFNHTGLFRLPENDVLFIKPELSREMLSLKDHFLDSKDQFEWSPHSTLLIDKSDVIQKAMPIVLDEFSPFAGKVKKLYLYEFWPTRHILTVEIM
ncbi:MAG: 2'-5' RNA ligase family protein [Eubacterium sp.]|nr:2'-5' RNA ligase family protein [Eubacterium sp.]